MKKHLWVEKYRPTTLEQYIFQNKEIEKKIKEYLNERSIPHLLFSGPAGLGKTTLALLLANHLVDENDILIINASNENNVETIREKIYGFVTTLPVDSEFKVIILDESDYISPAGQAILRRMMEEYYQSARFILTCNYHNRIIPAIKSRCQEFEFKGPNKDDIAEYIANILISEKVKFNIDDLYKFIAVGYPDVRKIINLIQQNTISNKLTFKSQQNDSHDYKFALLEFIEKDQWVKAREFLANHLSNDQWEEVYRFLYENLDKSKKFKNREKWEQGIVIIAEYMYKHQFVADPEINGVSCLIQLGSI